MDTVTQTMEIPLDQIVAGDNDRKVFDLDEIIALAENIDALGLIQPVTVEPSGIPGTPWRIVTGERRFRAFQILGRATITARLDDSLSAAVQSDRMLAENMARVDLTTMEEAEAYAKRIEAGATVDHVAKIAGVARFRVEWRLSLLKLIPEAQEAVKANVLPNGPALDLAKLTPDRQRVALAAWMKNPTMGAMVYRRLCEQLAAAANEPEEMSFELDLMIETVKAARPKTRAELVTFIGRLADALEESGYVGKLLHDARSIV